MAVLTPEQRQQLAAGVRALRERGLSYRAIGRDLGISHELARRIDLEAQAATTTLTTLTPQLGHRGQSFWAFVQDTYDLTRQEVEVLTQVCRHLDAADQLQAEVDLHGPMVTTPTGLRRPNPALAEIRQVSAAIGRLIAQLGLPDDEGAATVPSPTTLRAQKAANVRHARTAQRRAEREG